MKHLKIYENWVTNLFDGKKKVKWFDYFDDALKYVNDNIPEIDKSTKKYNL